jgi:hypothetical protein
MKRTNSFRAQNSELLSAERTYSIFTDVLWVKKLREMTAIIQISSGVFSSHWHVSGLKDDKATVARALHVLLRKIDQLCLHKVHETNAKCSVGLVNVTYFI